MTAACAAARVEGAFAAAWAAERVDDAIAAPCAAGRVDDAFAAPCAAERVDDAFAAARLAGARTASTRFYLIALLFALGLGARGANAEPLYVIDQLVISVNNAPGNDGERVATLKSGDRVDLLDRQGDETQVQLPNGESGWLKSSYLSTEPPLQVRLLERTAEVEKLKQDVTRLESQLATARATQAAAGGATGTSTAGGARPGGPANTSGAASTPGTSGAGGTGGAAGAAGAARTSSGDLQAQATSAAGSSSQPSEPLRDASSFLSPAEQAGQPGWLWVAGSFAVALVIGFGVGWRVLDRRIRRKYGGLRIY